MGGNTGNQLQVLGVGGLADIVGNVDPPSVAAFTMGQLSSANNLFALELFHTLNESNPTGNTIFSPVSISSALAMVYLGARGSTAAQLSKVSRSKTGIALPPISMLKAVPQSSSGVFSKPCQTEFNSYSWCSQTFRKDTLLLKSQVLVHNRL